MSAASDQGSVRFELEGGIARLTFDRPAARNAMTWAMYDGLAEACARLQDADDVRVAVLRGAGGRAFVAGTDIGQFTGFTSGEDGIAYEAKIDGYVSTLEALPVPTIAVVEGWAVGGGLAIANACDLRIATAGARFGAPIARTIGNCLSPANLRRLSDALGPAVVKRMLLLGEMPTADALQPLGYLAAVVAPEALDAELAAMCDRLLGHAPLTMRATKETLRRLATDPRAEAPDLIRACYGSQDFRTGVAAFLAKTTPHWQGR